MTDCSTVLRKIFHQAVLAVSGDTATEVALRNFDKREIYLVAVGKAASSMTQGALNVVNDSIVRGLVISKYNHIDERLKQESRISCMESAHPVPDENCLAAGAALVNFLRSIPRTAELLFLTSGGASSLVEALPALLNLSDLQRVNQYLLGSGMDINQLNRVRRAISLIKGGRLAGNLQNKHTTQLLISDVPGDTLSSIGSGLLIPAVDEELPEMPIWLQQMVGEVGPPPPGDDDVWSTIDSQIVASNRMAREAAADIAQAMELSITGLPVRQRHGLLDTDVGSASREIAKTLSGKDALPGIYIWGGETTVELPLNPGRGGRNQQLALQLAADLRGVDGWEALCCGTDGSDGPTLDAGGHVDSHTIERGQELHLNVDDFLERADAGSYLQKTECLVTTGPTGTNVMDLVIACRK